MKKIAIIRALDLRLTQAEHAAHFKRLKPVFVSNENKEIENYLREKSIEHQVLKLARSHMIDPVWLLSRKTTHQSWYHFNKKDLEKVLINKDIYHLQEPFFIYSGQVASMSMKFDKPLILATWMCFDHLSTYLPPYSFSVKKVIENTDLFVMRTNRVERYLSKFNIPASKKVMIYHGVDTKRFRPAKRSDDGVVRILFVGVLHESKGLADILDIFPKLVKESKRKIELVVCGAGELEDRVKKMAKDHPIRFLGKVAYSKLHKVFQESDIFCGPSKDRRVLGKMTWEEGFGFVFAEALSSGLPVVTNDCGAIKEVVGDVNYVNDQDDKEALYKSLLELIQDRRLRREVGTKNRKRTMELFDISRQTAKEENEIIKRFL